MKVRLLSTAVVALLLFVGCQSPVTPYLGDYSYKTSGRIEIAYDTVTLSHTLSDKIGQMDIHDRQNGDTMLIVMNEMNGNVHYLQAVAGETGFAIVPYTRHVNLKGIAALLNNEAEVTVTGSGNMYDDRTILIEESYEGHFSIGDSINGTITGNNILTVAKRN